MPSTKAGRARHRRRRGVRESLAFLLATAGIAVADLRICGRVSRRSLPASSAGCIITDVRMPGMSGIDLLRRLQELEASACR